MNINTDNFIVVTEDDKTNYTALETAISTAKNNFSQNRRNQVIYKAVAFVGPSTLDEIPVKDLTAK